MIFRGGWISMNRPQDQISCQVMPTRLGGDDAEQMQRIRMIGRNRQHLSIQNFRFAQQSIAMIREGLIERFLDGHAVALSRVVLGRGSARLATADATWR